MITYNVRAYGDSTVVEPTQPGVKIIQNNSTECYVLILA